jgi:heptosyltransferase III
MKKLFRIFIHLIYYLRLILPFFLMLFSIIRNFWILLIIYIKYKLLLKKSIIIINLTEHIGDIVACEPVSRYIRSQYPRDYIIWCTNKKYKSLIDKNPSINKVITVLCLTEWIYLKKLPIFDLVFDLHIDGRICTTFGKILRNPNPFGITLLNYFQYGSLLESFSLAANLPRLNDAPLYYLKNNQSVKKSLKELVIHASSNEAERDWEPQKWKLLVEYLCSNGFIVDEIGLKSEININHENFRNLCGQLSFDDIAILISKAGLFIGVDSAFAHFANALNTPGIILMGWYRNFKKYMPYTGNYQKGINCSIIQFDGPVKDIPLEEVISQFKQIQNFIHS